MRVLVTHQDYVDVISRIRGVESVSVEEAGIGKALVTIRYWIWIFLVPGLNWGIRWRVRTILDERKPFGTEVQMAQPLILAETPFQILVAMVWAMLLALLVRGCQ